jgi:hypothetical protein
MAPQQQFSINCNAGESPLNGHRKNALDAALKLLKLHS